MGKQNIIHLNGKRYDAHTGAPLDPRDKPLVVQAIKPAVPVVHHKTSHKVARSATRHKQQRSSTLMRQSVHKPGASLKRHTKVQSNLAALIEQPDIKIAPKLSFSVASPKRLELAKKIKRSDLIMHFNPNQPDYSTHRVTVTVNKPAPQPAATPKPLPRQAAPDLDDIFERAIQNATSHLEPAPRKVKKHRFHVGRKHARA